MTDILSKIEKGLIIEVEDIKQADSVNKLAQGVFVSSFNLDLVDEILKDDSISVPVIASCRTGHFIEAKLLEKLGVSLIDESIVNSPHYIRKTEFSTPFMCMVANSSEADHHIREGATVLRTKFADIGELGGLLTDLSAKGSSCKYIASLNIATPADIAYLLQSGCHAIITSSEIFRSPNPPKLIDSLVNTTKYYSEIDKVYEFSKFVSKILPVETK